MIFIFRSGILTMKENFRILSKMESEIIIIAVMSTMCKEKVQVIFDKKVNTINEMKKISMR